MDGLSPCPYCGMSVWLAAAITGRWDGVSTSESSADYLPRWRAKPKKEGKKEKLRLAKARIAELEDMHEDATSSINLLKVGNKKLREANKEQRGVIENLENQILSMKP
jgi:hypothetical protein